MDFRATSAIRTALARAPLRDTGRTVGGGDNVNGALRVLETVGEPSYGIIAKPAAAGAVQEVVAARIGARLGIDHLLPVAVLRDDTALLQLIDGAPAGSLGVRSSAALDTALAGRWVQAGAGPAQAQRAAQRDRELLSTFDHLLSNDDRHPANLMLGHRAVGAIDQGSIGNGEMPDALVPRLAPWFVADATTVGGHVQLGADALAAVRALDPAGVAGELRALRDAAGMPNLHNPLLDGVASSAFADRVLQRLDHVQRTGGFDWVSAHHVAPPEPRILELAVR